MNIFTILTFLKVSNLRATKNARINDLPMILVFRSIIFYLCVQQGYDANVYCTFMVE